VARELAQAVHGALLVQLPGVGHVLHQEAPDALEAVLRPFLESAEEHAARR
jgi:pimeloyl-ACP methyl ester carboxylesterase